MQTLAAWKVITAGETSNGRYGARVATNDQMLNPYAVFVGGRFEGARERLLGTYPTQAEAIDAANLYIRQNDL